MLRWCAHCQRFQGETAPWDRFEHTHGICPRCVAAFIDSNFAASEQSRELEALHRELRAAGARGDVASATALVDRARSAGFQPVDILLGVVSPLLYQIGEDWARGTTTPEAEQRFTTFCESLYGVVLSRERAARGLPKHEPDAILMCARGNVHTLGVRMLALWLLTEGAHIELLSSETPTDAVIARIEREQPRALMISMALADQREGVVQLAAHVEQLPDALRPRVFVGGFAVKTGEVAAIPGAEFLTDLEVLRGILREWGIGPA